MEEMKLYVPTYYGKQNAVQPGGEDKPDFAEPDVPVFAYRSDGLRVVLGSHDDSDDGAPDVQIERRPHGWAIFLHPLGGSDPSGYVYFLDTGESFLIPGCPFGPTKAIELLKSDTDTVPGLDQPGEPAVGDELPRICELCNARLADTGEEWEGLCPRCADLVSLYVDFRGWSEERRHEAILALQSHLRE